MSSSWHIPAEYPKFSKKTYIICLSSRSAKVYSAFGDELLLETPIETEATDVRYSDREGLSFSRGSGVGTSPGTEPHNKEHYDRVFLNYLVEQVHDLFRAQRFEHLIVFTPESFRNLLPEKLPQNIRDITEFYGGNLENEHPLDLLKRLKKPL